eukprot:6206712-Pleurochrysis_carterae.AAC.2
MQYGHPKYQMTSNKLPACLGTYFGMCGIRPYSLCTTSSTQHLAVDDLWAIDEPMCIFRYCYCAVAHVLQKQKQSTVQQGPWLT